MKVYLIINLTSGVMLKMKEEVLIFGVLFDKMLWNIVVLQICSEQSLSFVFSLCNFGIIFVYVVVCYFRNCIVMK